MNPKLPVLRLSVVCCLFSAVVCCPGARASDAVKLYVIAELHAAKRLVAESNLSDSVKETVNNEIAQAESRVNRLAHDADVVRNAGEPVSLIDIFVKVGRQLKSTTDRKLLLSTSGSPKWDVMLAAAWCRADLTIMSASQAEVEKLSAILADMEAYAGRIESEEIVDPDKLAARRKETATLVTKWVADLDSESGKATAKVKWSIEQLRENERSTTSGEKRPGRNSD